VTSSRPPRRRCSVRRTESAEVGTPDDVAQAEAEKPIEVVVVAEYPMYYAAVKGDLAKRALELAKAAGKPAEDAELDAFIAIAKAAGGRCEHDLAKAAAEPRSRRSTPRSSRRSSRGPGDVERRPPPQSHHRDRTGRHPRRPGRDEGELLEAMSLSRRSSRRSPPSQRPVARPVRDRHPPIRRRRQGLGSTETADVLRKFATRSPTPSRGGPSAA